MGLSCAVAPFRLESASMSMPSQAPEQSGGSVVRKRNVRLREELWDALDAVAARVVTKDGKVGVSTNALLEAAAEKLTGVGQAQDESRENDQAAFKRLSIRLKEADREEVRAHAKAMGSTVTRWVTALIRARIRKAPLLSVAETEALAEANRQLAAVGRNLNTVVHRLHREGRWAGNLDLYAELLASVKAVRARVEAVIASGQARAEDD